MSVFNKIKHLVQHSAIYSIASVLQKASGFLLIPFLTNKELLSTEDYSAYLFIIPLAGVLTQMLAMGMESTIVRFIKLNPENKQSIINSAITVVLCSICFGFLVSNIFELEIARYGIRDETMSELVIFITILASFDLLSNLPNYYFRADERPKTFMNYKIIRFVLEYGGIVVGLYFFKMGIKGAIYGMVTASIISFLIIIPFYIKFFKIEFNKPLIKEMLLFGLPLIPNAILYILIEMTDRYFLDPIMGKETQTIYTNMYKFGGVLTVINLAFRNAWQPIMLREVQEKNNNQFFSKVMTYFVAFSSIIMIFISLLAIDFIQYNPFEFIRLIIHDESYFQGKHILGFILFGYVMLGIYYNLSLAFYVKKKSSSFMVLTGIGLFANILINCFMFKYPSYGTYIASFATFVSFFLMAFFAYRKSMKLFPVNYNISALSSMFLYMIGVTIIVTFYGDLSFLIKSLIAFGYIPYLYVMNIISKDDIAQIKRLMGR